MSEKKLTQEELEKAAGGKRAALTNKDLEKAAGGKRTAQTGGDLGSGGFANPSTPDTGSGSGGGPTIIGVEPLPDPPFGQG